MLLLAIGLANRISVRQIPMQIMVGMVMAMILTAANAQSGTIMTCTPAPPLISLAPPLPNSMQPITIQVLVDDGGASSVVVSSLGAVIHGNTIDVTLVGFTFSPAPAHLPVCGSIPLAPLPAATYTVNFFYTNTSTGGPPFLLASSGFTVTASIADHPIPTLGASAVVILALLIVLSAAIRIPSRGTS
jgi:hypothetical protein